MSEELSAVSKIAPAPAVEGDYEAIYAALMQTERGRWFLHEYASRNRSADTTLLLAAIQRIEAVVCAERSRQAQQSFRSNLLEMASAITELRAEVAEIRPDAPVQSARPDGKASPLPPPQQSGDVFAAAERIRDVTWAMRGHGFDPSTCDQLEELARSILSASSLRDPTDRRASKLNEVLQYLEQRIGGMLESSADAEAAPVPAQEPQSHAFTPQPSCEAEAANGFAPAFVTAEFARNEGATDEGPALLLSPPTEIPDLPLAAQDDVEDEDAGTTSAQAVEIPPVETGSSLLSEPALDPGAQLQPVFTESAPAAAGPPFPTNDPNPAPGDAAAAPISAQNQEVGGRTANVGAACAPVLMDGAEAAYTDAATVAAEFPAADHSEADEQGGTPGAVMPAAGVTRADALLPTVELDSSNRWPRQASRLQVVPTASENARAFLPEVDMRSELPSFDATPVQHASPVPSAEAPEAPPLVRPAGTNRETWQVEGARPLQRVAALAVSPPVAALPPQPAGGAAAPQATGSDLLAAVRAMSDEELIALFS